MSEQLCTVAQAAERLRLHPKTVLRLMREGRLRGTRIGKSYRILLSDLNAFAGITDAVPPTPLRARVTCVVDIEPVAPEKAQRLSDFLDAAVVADPGNTHQLRVTTCYEPESERLRVVLFGTPPAAAEWLQLLQVRLESVG